MNRTLISCWIISTIFVPASFSMDVKPDGVSCWDDLPCLPTTEPTAEIKENIMPSHSQYCPSEPRMLVPPLPIPPFYTNYSCAVPQQASSASSPQPSSNPLESIEQFQRDIIASTEKLLLLQNRHIELTQLLQENSNELLCLDHLIALKLITMKALFNINRSNPYLNGQLTKLLNESNHQRAATQRIKWPIYLRHLLHIQQVANQQFAKILEFELKETT